jgi:hypothetical protein
LAIRRRSAIATSQLCRRIRGRTDQIICYARDLGVAFKRPHLAITAVHVLVLSGISATAGNDRPDADALLGLPAEEDRGQATCSMRWLIVRCLPTR